MTSFFRNSLDYLAQFRCNSHVVVVNFEYIQCFNDSFLLLILNGHLLAGFVQYSNKDQGQAIDMGLVFSSLLSTNLLPSSSAFVMDFEHKRDFQDVFVNPRYVFSTLLNVWWSFFGKYKLCKMRCLTGS